MLASNPPLCTEQHHHSGGNCVQGPGGRFRRGSWDLALRILWGTIFPLQHYFRHTLSRTILLSPEKRQQERELGEPDLSSAKVPGSGPEGMRVPKIKGRQKCHCHPRPSMETAKTQQSHTWMEELSSCLVQHRGPMPPRAPQRICLGTTPTPPAHREVKRAGIWDRHHRIKVHGSEYEMGLFTLDWFQESCCPPAVSCIIGLTAGLDTHFFW